MKRTPFFQPVLGILSIPALKNSKKRKETCIPSVGDGVNDCWRLSQHIKHSKTRLNSFEIEFYKLWKYFPALTNYNFQYVAVPPFSCSPFLVAILNGKKTSKGEIFAKRVLRFCDILSNSRKSVPAKNSCYIISEILQFFGWRHTISHLCRKFLIPMKWLVYQRFYKRFSLIKPYLIFWK